MDIKKKVTGVLGEKALDMLEKMIGDIDLFDQLGEMLKTVVPLKAEITVKGKKALEVRAMIKEDSLFLKVTRIKEEKPAETTKEETPEELAEKSLEELENVEATEAEA